MKCDCILQYSKIVSTIIGIYAIIKTNNDEVINEFDEFFRKNYEGYHKANLDDNYIVYIFNGSYDFDLASDLKVCIE